MSERPTMDEVERRPWPFPTEVLPTALQSLAPLARTESLKQQRFEEARARIAAHLTAEEVSKALLSDELAQLLRADATPNEVGRMVKALVSEALTQRAMGEVL